MDQFARSSAQLTRAQSRLLLVPLCHCSSSCCCYLDSSSSTGVPSASLCPSANGQTVNGYVVGCQSDTSIGSYSNAMPLPRTWIVCPPVTPQASTGCVAFTYVGGAQGSGSGACYLKNSKGSFTVAGGNNYVSGMIASSASSSLSSSSLSSTQSDRASSSGAASSSSTTTSSSATASASSNLCLLWTRRILPIPMETSTPLSASQTQRRLFRKCPGYQHIC